MSRRSDPPAVDVERVVDVLTRHHVEFILVGGAAATMFGAHRLTEDTDCLARRTEANLERLSAAMQELGARLRVEGLSDEEAAALPVQIDKRMLAEMEISTWTTDSGWFDVLADIPARDGHRLLYEDVIDTAVTFEVAGVTVAVANLDVIIASKEWANRPKDLLALPELRRLRDGAFDSGSDP